MRLLLFFFLMFVVNAQSQTNASVALREISLNISVDNKNGKEFFYRKEDRYVYNNSCVIIIKKKDEKRSKANRVKRISTGYREKGTFRQGYKNGKWKTTYKNKVVKEENWNNGLIIGMYRVLNLKGKLLYEMVFTENGTSKYKDYYYKTGILKVEGNYTSGKKQGKWHYYNEKGEKIKTINYTQGLPNA